MPLHITFSDNNASTGSVGTIPYNTINGYQWIPISAVTSGITATGNYLPLSGGTVTGSTVFTGGLTANTISATTYLNLPSTSGAYLPLSGGTLTGVMTGTTIVVNDNISFSGSNNIFISNFRSIPNVSGNTNWSDTGEIFKGPWSADPVTYDFGDLVSFSGDIYQNQTGVNGTDDPTIDTSNWLFYLSPYIGIWNSGTTYAQSVYASQGQSLYIHTSPNQYVFTGIRYDGTKFIFGNNTQDWLYISASTLSVGSIKSPTGSLSLNPTSSVSLAAPTITTNASITNSNFATSTYTAGILTGTEINIQDNDAGQVTSSVGVARALFLGSRNGKIGQGTYNAALVGGFNNVLLSGCSNSVIIGGLAITGTTGDAVYVPNLTIQPERKIFIGSGGTNPSAGVIVLTGGAATVSTGLVTMNSLIQLTIQGGDVSNVGSVYVSSRANGSSFDIASTNASDGSTVGWQIFETY